MTQHSIGRTTRFFHCGLGLVACLFLLTWTGLSVAAGPAKQAPQGPPAVKKSGAEPIHIKSDRMEAMDQQGTVIFTGNVVSTKGDLTIHSDRLEVFYENQKEPAKTGDEGTQKTVRKIIAKGHVRMTYQGKVATGQEAVYDRAAETVTLIGSAQVWEGPSRVNGDRIILYINEDRSVVQSNGPDRVEAIVYPSE